MSPRSAPPTWARSGEHPSSERVGVDSTNGLRDAPRILPTPTTSGVVERDGIRIHFHVYGSGDTTIAFLPAWMITNSHLWDAQVAGLADTHRIVTYDARGCGRSDRPTTAEAYALSEHLGDLVAVLDATATERAVLVGNSFGGILALVAAGLISERVSGTVYLGPSVDLVGDTGAPLHRAFARFHDHLDEADGWARFNRHAWDRDYEGFARWFIGLALPELGSEAERRQAFEWALDNTAEVLAATIVARSAMRPVEAAQHATALVSAIDCPALVIHGSGDEIAPVRWGRALARALDCTYVEIEGAGHCPQAVHSVEVNRHLDDFVRASAPAHASTR